MTKSLSRILSRFCFAGICMIALSAHSDKETTPEEKAWKYRDGVFRVIHWKFGKMIEAKQQKNQAAFVSNAKDMAYLAGMVVEGFELKDSMPEGTLAKKAIWQDWDDFSAKTKEFQKNVQALAESGDLDAFNPRKFGSENCGGCHRKYKEKH